MKSKNRSQGFKGLMGRGYGGGTWHTWTDRDLKVAGKVIVRVSSGAFVTKSIIFKSENWKKEGGVHVYVIITDEGRGKRVLRRRTWTDRDLAGKVICRVSQ